MSATLFSLMALVVSLLLLTAWVWRPGSRERFEAAARLPFLDDEVSTRALPDREADANVR